MSRYGAPAQSQTQLVVAHILEDCRRLIPDLVKSPRASVLEFSIKIRNGTIDTMNIDNWDECFAPVHHVNSGEPDQQLNRMEAWLMKFLPTKLVNTFHGTVVTLVTVKEQSVAFAFRVHRQRLYTWREDGTANVK